MTVRSASIGLEALGANPLRTVLFTLGVVIGVAALVAVLALGDGVERFTREQFANTTSIQAILVAPRSSITVDGVRVPGNAFPTFTAADAQAVLAEVPGVSEVQLRMTGSGRITPAPEELNAMVAVISPGLARWIDGDTLILEGRPRTVIGVFAVESSDSLHRVIVPGVTITTQAARAKQARQGVLLFKLLMGAVTGISLLVGGIGIMNVLLASVPERTREIGIRKATGARQRDIMMQFLAESVAITGVGSLAGVVLGLATGFGVAAFMRMQTQAQVQAAFTWGTVAVAVLAAVMVGLVFGICPALRAARLSPIDAIRHE